MAILHGKNLVVSIGGTAIAAAKSCDINIDCEQIEISSPTSSQWREFLNGRLAWHVTVGTLMVKGQFKNDIQRVGTLVRLSMTDGTNGNSLSGYANVASGKFNGTVGNLAAGTFEFQGTGALS